MHFLRFTPIILSSILISAHFQRGGYSVVAVLCFLSPGLLLLKKEWARHLVKALLILFSIEWVRTLFNLVQLRMEHEMPWVRLAIIIGSVALFTLASSLWLHRTIGRNTR